MSDDALHDDDLSDDERVARMAKGREAFNAGDFYEAHELWEEVWNVIDDPRRRWVQGLIQVATGLHKLAAGRDDVCATLLQKALGKLHDAPPALDGVDVAAARAGAETILAAIRKGGPLPEARSVRV